MTDSNSELNALPVGEKYYPKGNYEIMRKEAMENSDKFWSNIASELSWSRTWDSVLDWQPPFAKWFTGGKLNACVNAVDRHVKTDKKNKAAFIWEGENGEKRVLTYSDLYREINRFAAGLKRLGIKKGDKIAFYMPMVPEFAIAVLAATRIGAPFTVVFSGFSASALSERINDCEAKLIVTADGLYRRGKILELKEIVDEAVTSSPSVQNVVVLQRVGNSVNMVDSRDVFWTDLVNYSGNGTTQSVYVEPEPVDADHPLYILYTSGTTGKPKGVLHGTGGYLTWAYATTRWVFDIQDDDVYWCPADIGWVTGHTYVIFGPLLHGATSIMYEGAPDYPNPERLWQIIERYKVTIFYFTPTGIRALMKFGDELPGKYDLNSIRTLGTVGEPINPAAWKWYFNVIGSGRCPIVDTWWQTETGGIMISPSTNLGLVPLKPGSGTFPLPGVDADIVDENGNSLPPEEKGFIVIKKPWPGMFMTLYKDPERYQEVYWSKFDGMYYPGDYAVRDRDGYFWFLGRADEVLNVSGHRLGTIEIEDAIVSHDAITEAAVAGKPDKVKGESIVVFCVVHKNYTPSEDLKNELKIHVRKEIGPVATPDGFHFVNMLPKTRSGKIMRRVVKAVASGSEIGDVTTLEDGASVEEVKNALAEFSKSLD